MTSLSNVNCFFKASECPTKYNILKIVFIIKYGVSNYIYQSLILRL